MQLKTQTIEAIDTQAPAVSIHVYSHNPTPKGTLCAHSMFASAGERSQLSTRMGYCKTPVRVKTNT